MSHTLTAGIRTLVLVPLFFLLTLLMALLVIIVGRFGPDSPRIESLIQTWSRLFLRIPPVDYASSGSENVVPGQYVVVSNHLSNFDIPLLFRTVPLRIRFLAKKEIYKIPLVAQAMDTAGIVKIDRQSGMSTHEAINAAVAASRARGYSLIVFPEGTRSRTGDMGEFKKGAFRIAVDGQLPILPVVINGTFAVNPPGKKMIYPGHADVRILEPIPTSGMARKDVKALMGATREQMVAVYASMRADRDGV
jgi:1-acyl-sn-glycerol-3-phosphate acyltransferase